MADSMEAMEVSEWVESVIEDLIEEYKCCEENNNLDWRNGAIEALDKLLEKLKEE